MDSSDTWMDMNSCTDFSCYYSYTNRYTIDGDTTIGGVQYSKFYVKTKYETGAAPSEWCTESVNYWEHYYGAVRESGKKIFVIPYDSSDSTEYVAYDFNLTVGDTLTSPNGSPGANYPNIISSIDSVLVFGNYRKRFVVDSYRFVIEGIGASTGLFNPIEITSNCNNELLCYAEHDVSDYFQTNCNYNLSINELNNKQNPAQLIKIVDCLGRETEYKPNTLLIYLFSDGSSEKVFRVE